MLWGQATAFTSLCRIHLTGQMMDIKFVLSISLFMTAACASAGEVQHGIIKLDGEGHAVLVVAEPLASGESVYFQYPGASQRALCCKQLMARAFTRADGTDTLASNEITGHPPVVYSAAVPKPWAQMPFVGAVTIGRGLQAKGSHGWLLAKTRQGRSRRVQTCTSQEGVHLIDKKGDAEVTHLYLGLGYDIDHPSCK